MKTLHLFLSLSAVSLTVMVIVDLVLGPKAEFLNAYSVVQRMIGQTPSAGESLAVQKFGAFGELGAVVAVNLVIGGTLTAFIRFFT